MISMEQDELTGSDRASFAIGGCGLDAAVVYFEADGTDELFSGSGNPFSPSPRTSMQRINPSVAVVVLALALLIFGAMHRYSAVQGTVAVVDRWTGQVCARERCWKDGAQTVPTPPRPLSEYTPNWRDGR